MFGRYLFWLSPTEKANYQKSIYFILFFALPTPATLSITPTASLWSAWILLRERTPKPLWALLAVSTSPLSNFPRRAGSREQCSTICSEKGAEAEGEREQQIGMIRCVGVGPQVLRCPLAAAYICSCDADGCVKVAVCLVCFPSCL